MRQTEVERRDASYVLDWLRQTDAPVNIVALQERVVAALGGFVDFTERTRLHSWQETSAERRERTKREGWTSA